MRWADYAALTAAVLILLAYLLLAGCATMNQRCEYTNGELDYIRTRATVIGTGTTELVSIKCADMSYSTADTGISDNGKDTVLGLGELASDAATGGATAVVRKVGD